jgi:hypothetical protein
MKERKKERKKLKTEKKPTNVNWNMIAIKWFFDCCYFLFKKDTKV